MKPLFLSLAFIFYFMYFCFCAGTEIRIDDLSHFNFSLPEKIYPGFRYAMAVKVTSFEDSEEVLLTIDTQELITGGKLRDDCVDLRVLKISRYNESGIVEFRTSKVNFWVEGGCGTEETNVWIQDSVNYMWSNESYFVVMYGSLEDTVSESMAWVGSFFVFSTTDCGEKSWNKYALAEGVYIVSTGIFGESYKEKHSHGVYHESSPPLESNCNKGDEFYLCCNTPEPGGLRYAKVQHTHKFPGYGEDRPLSKEFSMLPHLQLGLCTSQEFSDLPKSSISLFKDDTDFEEIPDWERYAKLDGRFPFIGFENFEEESDYVGHNHTYDYNRFYRLDDFVECAMEMPGGASILHDYHSHFISPPLEFVELPSHREVLFGVSDKGTLHIHPEMIVMASIEPPLGFERYNLLENKYLMGSPEGDAGNGVPWKSPHVHIIPEQSLSRKVQTKFHPLFMGMVGPMDDKSCLPSGKGCVCYSALHSHNVTANLTEEANYIPPYYGMLFFQRKDLDFEVELASVEAMYFLVCHGKSETDENVCNQRGKCTAVGCQCDVPFYGENCVEDIANPRFLDEDILLIDFSVELSILLSVEHNGQEGEYDLTKNYPCGTVVPMLEDMDGIICFWNLKIEKTTSFAIDFSKSNSDSTMYKGEDAIIGISLLTKEGIISLGVTQYEFTVSWEIIAICSGSVFVVCCFLAVLIFTVLLCILGSQKKTLSKFENVEDLDLILQEIQAERTDSSSKPQVKINQKLFEIPYEEVRLERTIAAGGSGASIFKAKYKDTDVVFKVFKVDSFLSSTQEEYDFSEVERELEMLGNISHPGIIQFIGSSLKLPRIGILLEWAKLGDLEHHMLQYSYSAWAYSVREKIELSKQILSALSFLHEKDIIHRDLKSKNILLTSRNVAKICDFGLSRMVRNEESIKLTTRIGTDRYMAPELSRGSSKYSNSVDTFSMSIVLWELFMEDFRPYQSLNVKEMKLVDMAVANDAKFRPPLSEEKFGSFQWLKPLLKKMWSHVPQERPSISEVYNIFHRIDKESSKSNDGDLLSELEKEKEELKSRMKDIDEKICIVKKALEETTE